MKVDEFRIDGKAKFVVNDKGLTEFTNSRLTGKMPTQTKEILKLIVEGENLDLTALLDLTPEQREKFEKVLTGGYLTLAGNDREALEKNTEEILSETSRNEIWERNHYVIMNTISYLTRSFGQLPTITRIANETGLSRVTIHKHLKSYYDSDIYKEKANALKFLRETLLLKTYELAFYGDLKATKIFMDNTKSDLDIDHPSIRNQQNNFMFQLNGHTITNQQIEHLPFDKKSQLEEILSLIRL